MTTAKNTTTKNNEPFSGVSIIQHDARRAAENCLRYANEATNTARKKSWARHATLYQFIAEHEPEPSFRERLGWYGVREAVAIGMLKRAEEAMAFYLGGAK